MQTRNCAAGHGWQVLRRVILGAIIVIGLGGCGTAAAERRVEEAQGLGETRFFDFAPRSPLEWIDNDTVVFVSIDGTATIDLATGAVTQKVDPSVVPPNPIPDPVPGEKLSPGSRYGPWEVSGDARFLVADDLGDVECGALLVSPDGRYVACTYIVTDRWAESGEGKPAVIRLR
jgi:hypothetical protein